ncbi:MAG: hypothetical protein B6244_12445 [Candidatus Cloacimonetes bacterium 4572_55]|nr:MAG: hypothetical protein B6244_12445 [Candidatus Cloacimonetes bacterium 4572_55]
MGKIRQVEEVKLVIAMISNGHISSEQLFPVLIKEFGEIDFTSHRIPFDFTEYYRQEMGDRLYRQFISFEELIDPECLADVKLTTNRIEEEFGEIRENTLHRHVNLDSGYLTLFSFILASTKNYAHRIYLKKNIYAELELTFRKKQFQIVPWTFLDYRTEEYQSVLMHIRKIYRAQIRA